MADFIRLVEALGYQPVLLPFSPNGKAQHIKGFLTRFARTAQKTADFLNRVAQLGMPLVGVDPALVLCYRDEYKQTLGDKRGDFQVLLVHEWLPKALTSDARPDLGGEPWYLFGHCTEVTALPRRQSSGQIFLPTSARSWKTSALGVAGWLAPMVMK